MKTLDRRLKALEKSYTPYIRRCIIIRLGGSLTCECEKKDYPADMGGKKESKYPKVKVTISNEISTRSCFNPKKSHFK